MSKLEGALKSTKITLRHYHLRHFFLGKWDENGTFDQVIILM